MTTLDSIIAGIAHYLADPDCKQHYCATSEGIRGTCDRCQLESFAAEQREFRKKLVALRDKWREAIAKLQDGVKDSPSHDLKRMIKERVEATTICADELTALLDGQIAARVEGATGEEGRR